MPSWTNDKQFPCSHWNCQESCRIICRDQQWCYFDILKYSNFWQIALCLSRAGMDANAKHHLHTGVNGSERATKVVMDCPHTHNMGLFVFYVVLCELVLFAVCSLSSGLLSFALVYVITPLVDGIFFVFERSKVKKPYRKRRLIVQLYSRQVLYHNAWYRKESCLQSTPYSFQWSNQKRYRDDKNVIKSDDLDTCSSKIGIKNPAPSN